MTYLVCYWNGEKMVKETLFIVDDRPIKVIKNERNGEFIAQKCQEITGFKPSSYSTIS